MSRKSVQTRLTLSHDSSSSSRKVKTCSKTSLGRISRDLETMDTTRSKSWERSVRIRRCMLGNLVQSISWSFIHWTAPCNSFRSIAFDMMMLRQSLSICCGRLGSFFFLIDLMALVVPQGTCFIRLVTWLRSAFVNTKKMSGRLDSHFGFS